jgi:aldehyde dehydrogenase (NAD+)
MSTDKLSSQLPAMRKFHESGATRSHAFRSEQLKKLRSAIIENENALHEALYADLKKSPEESWVTETGFVISEINAALKHLKDWMRPEKTGTNLLNLPSTSYILKEPLGVVLIIGPWNYPLQLLFTPLVGAIAAGNAVVIKPSEFASATAEVMQSIIDKTFAREYVWYVQGDGAELVPALMNDFRFDHIFYTGSTAIGKKIYEAAASKLVPVTLELGGKSPCVIESGADIAVAARRIAVTKFSNAGQMCVAPDYILVHKTVKEKFIEKLKHSLVKFFSEDASSSYSYGKIINQRQFDRLVNYLKEGRIVFGGKANREKLFIEPTVLEDVNPDSRVMSEEIFGPILPVISFESFAEAKAIIEKNPDPLAFYIFTSSNKTEKKWLEEIHFGGGCVNNASWHLTNHHLPFGGRGNSGIGSYHGKNSFETFSHRKAIMKTPTWFDPNIKYPPFKGKLWLFKKVVK